MPKFTVYTTESESTHTLSNDTSGMNIGVSRSIIEGTVARYNSTSPDSMTSDQLNKCIPKYSAITKAVIKATLRRNKKILYTDPLDLTYRWYQSGSSVLNLKTSTDAVTASNTNFTYDLLKKGYIHSKNENAGKFNVSSKYTSFAFFVNRGNNTDVTLYSSKRGIEYEYTPPSYTINATSQEGGTVSGGGTYEVGILNKTINLVATPSPGYKFIRWDCSNGNSYVGESNKNLAVTFSHNDISAYATTVNYTAVFEPIHVTNLSLSHNSLNIKMADNVELVHDYINTLNLKGLSCGTPNCVSEIKPNYLMLRSTANDAYVGSYGMSSPISDTAKMYVFDIDPDSKYTYIVNAKVPEGAQYSIFVFYYDSNYNYIYHDAQTDKTSGQTIINDSNPWSKQIPANAKYASIRVDNDISGYEIYYTNVLVYKGNLDSIYNSAAIAEIIKPDNALNKVVMWSSSEPDVVTINEDTGILTAKSSGAAVITCQSRDGAFTAYCTVNVAGESITNIYLGSVPITGVYLGDLPLTPCLGTLLL